MNKTREALRDHHESREQSADSRSKHATFTPIFEVIHGEGHRWAVLDVPDLDPPTPLFPGAAN